MEILKEYIECPRCKSSERVMEEIFLKEKAKGNMSEGIGCTRVEIFCNINPLKPPMAGARLPAVRTYKDICLGCGEEYIVKIEKGFAVLPLRQGMPPSFI